MHHLNKSAVSDSQPSLRARTLNAGAWTMASYAAEVSSRFLSNLLITRLLFPDAFGLMAASTALIVGLGLIGDVGIRTFIIQSDKGDSISMLRSAWTVQCILGLIIWFVLGLFCLVLSLPFIHEIVPPTSVFADTLFPLITITLGLCAILGGLESTVIALNVRRLNFRPVMVMDMSSRAVSLIITLAGAYLFGSVWALVVGSLSGNIGRLVLSHLVIPGPKMRFALRREELKEIIAFGKWINLSSVATFIATQGDVIILGILIPAPTLGVFYIAKTLKDAVETLLEKINGLLTLPVLSEVVRNNPNGLQERYYRFRTTLELVAFGTSGALFAAGDWLVSFLYDPRYQSAGIFLQVLSVGLLIYPFQIIRSAFTAYGRPQIVALASVLQAISVIIFVSSGFHLWGPIGAIAGTVVSRVIPSICLIAFAYRLGWIGLFREVKFLPVFLLAAFISWLIVHTLAGLTLVDLRHHLNFSFRS